MLVGLGRAYSQGMRYKVLTSWYKVDRPGIFPHQACVGCSACPSEHPSGVFASSSLDKSGLIFDDPPDRPVRSVRLRSM
jgi:hypothetical protein